MNSKVIIEDGISVIELTPENNFEEEVINTIENDYSTTDISVTTHTNKALGFPTKQKIALRLETKDKGTSTLKKLPLKQGVVRDMVLEFRRWNRLWQDYSNDIESKKPMDLDEFTKTLEEKYFTK